MNTVDVSRSSPFTLQAVCVKEQSRSGEMTILLYLGNHWRVPSKEVTEFNLHFKAPTGYVEDEIFWGEEGREAENLVASAYTRGEDKVGNKKV